MTNRIASLIARWIAAPVALAGVLVFASSASATTLTYQPAGGALNELDHHDVYMWRIDGINLGGQSIVSASLKFTNLRNWDSTANTLFLHLFDTAHYSGVATTQDVDSGISPVPGGYIVDAYTYALGSTYAPGVANLVKYYGSSMSDTEKAAINNVGNTFLSAPSGLTTTPSTYTWNFTSAQLLKLAEYIAQNGDIAIGLDPDCHYFTDSVILSIETTGGTPKGGGAVPEPASMVLLGSGLSALYLRRRRNRQ